MPTSDMERNDATTSNGRSQFVNRLVHLGAVFEARPVRVR